MLEPCSSARPPVWLQAFFFLSRLWRASEELQIGCQIKKKKLARVPARPPGEQNANIFLKKLCRAQSALYGAKTFLKKYCSRLRGLSGVEARVFIVARLSAWLRLRGHGWSNGALPRSLKEFSAVISGVSEAKY